MARTTTIFGTKNVKTTERRIEILTERLNALRSDEPERDGQIKRLEDKIGDLQDALDVGADYSACGVKIRY